MLRPVIDRHINRLLFARIFVAVDELSTTKPALQRLDTAQKINSLSDDQLPHTALVCIFIIPKGISTFSSIVALCVTDK